MFKDFLQFLLYVSILYNVYNICELMDTPVNNRKHYETLKEAHDLRLSDPKKALDKANSVYISAIKKGDQKLEARSLYEMSLCFELQTSYPKAMKCLTESIKLANSIGDTQVMADAFNCAGIINDKLGNYSNALKNYFKSLRLYEFLEDKKKKAIVIMNIGLIYSNIEDYKSALKFYSQALEIAEDEHDIESLLITNINLGLTHKHLGNYTDAERFLNDSIAIADSANDRQKKSLALDILADAAFSAHNYTKALEVLNISLNLKKELNDKKGTAKNYSLAGKLFLSEDRLDEAKNSFKQSLETAEENGFSRSIFEAHKYLAEICEKQGDYNNALEHLKKSHKFQLEYMNEVLESKTKNMATQLEIETVQKETEIERLKNVELANALSDVKQLNISLKELNDEKNEFMAIAVHDLKNPILNILSAAKLIKKRIPEKQRDAIEFTDNIIYQTDRMFGLIKKLLDHNAIEQGNIKINKTEFPASTLCEELIFNFSQQAESKNISINYINEINSRNIITDRELLYEILQNLLSNAIKFSPQNTKVTLKTYLRGNDMNFEVIDEGPGFTDSDKEKIFKKFSKLSAKPTGDEYSTGLGLSIVKKLTELIDGKIEFVSRPGEGTKFILSFKS